MSYNNWFGQNWQQDHGPMDHDVSNPGYVGYATNTSGPDDSMTYRTNITLEHCKRFYANETDQMLKTQLEGFCNVSFDNILCWPPTPHGTIAKVKCFSEFLGIRYDDTKNATRECTWNGTWIKSAYDDCIELDVYPTSMETQSNIYLIGYIISSVTLAIAIFIFTYFKELRCLRNKIHMNLMWSYLLTYCMWIIILIELNFREHMAVTCVFVVTLLHYFHITTFFWMFVEGLYLYILVVRTLTRESFKLRVYALIGWGTPLFFIIVWAVIKGILLERTLYDSSDACIWFGESHIDYIYQAPTIIVLVINIIFMVSIMIVLVTKLRSANTLEIQQYRKAVKALAVLIPLLGVTYAITIYAPALTIWDMLRSALLSVQLPETFTTSHEKITTKKMRWVPVILVLCSGILVTHADGSPCGICGVDVICKDRYPICSKNQVITLDYCGCCLVCKSILEKGEECSRDIETYAICKSGLECVNQKCADPKSLNG